MPDDTDAEIGFEAALNELETIVNELEQGGPDLTSALGRYERGIRLLNRCQALLDGAERSVALLAGVDAEGKPITAPFDASATATTPTPTPPPAPTAVPPVAVAPPSPPPSPAPPPPPAPAAARKAAPRPAVPNPSPAADGFDPNADPNDPSPPW